MSWDDLHQGILEEFAEAGRLGSERTFAALSNFSAKRVERHKQDCKAQRTRKARNPLWVAAENKRKALWKAANKKKQHQYKVASRARRKP